MAIPTSSPPKSSATAFSGWTTPLSPGPNYVTFITVDAATNRATNTLVITNTPGALTIDDFSGSLGGNPPTQIGEVTGETTLTNGYTLWVNGVQATNNGDGSWKAFNIPLGTGGTADVEARALPSSQSATNLAVQAKCRPSNPNSSNAVSAHLQSPQPPFLYVQSTPT